MRIVAEDVNDARKGLQSLKAIMMGPLLMAGGWVGGWVWVGGGGGQGAQRYNIFLACSHSLFAAPPRAGCHKK